ncbi:hypothetical protein SAMN04487843_102310 [Methylobacterium sp. ap11]|nr:hypothetical protein SAMN04487843_102310 [Methylobacterium sp. ap11]
MSSRNRTSNVRRGPARSPYETLMSPSDTAWLLFLTPVAVLTTPFAVICVTGRQDRARDAP